MSDRKVWLLKEDNRRVFFDYRITDNPLGEVTEIKSTSRHRIDLHHAVIFGLSDFGRSFIDVQEAKAYVEKVVSDKFDERRGRPQDNINPSHYKRHPSGVECITITRHMSFNLGNAVKYLWRAGLKTTSPIEDLKKAKWYLEDEITQLEKK